MNKSVNLSKNLGKILIIDDKYEDVQPFITQLLKQGFNVHYWDSKTDNEDKIRDARIVILDINLSEADDFDENQDASYVDAINAIDQINGTYIIIILSNKFTERTVTAFKRAWTNFKGSQPIPGILSEQGLTKDNPDCLIPIIDENIREKKIINLIILWEALISKAKDKALKKIFGEEMNNELLVFVRTLAKDFTENHSLTVEFVTEMLGFMERFIEDDEEFKILSNFLSSLSSVTEEITSQVNYLPNNRMYSKPNINRKIWTGDIFKITKKPKYNIKYNIVLTPVCDCAQSKTDFFLICEGYDISTDSINVNHPCIKIIKKSIIENKNKELKKILSKSDDEINKFRNSSDDEKDKEFYKSLTITQKQKIIDLLKNTNLAQRYKIYWNFSQDHKEYHGLIFDLQRVKSLKVSKLCSEKRIARLEHPFITEFIQQYGIYITRIGVPQINPVKEEK